MKFDKSKVFVAGLHVVKEGVCGWFADSINDLYDKVNANSVNRANGCLAKMKGQRDCLYVDEVNTIWRFFYPASEKKYRPFETIEEARVLIGRVLRHKLLKRLILVTVVEYCDTVIGDEFVCINGERASKILDKYIIDETDEPVGVEV